jgi:hypothetical protein
VLVVMVLAAVLTTGAVAAPASLTVDAPPTATADGTTTVSLELTNTGSEASAYILDISVPSGWTITAHEDDGGTWKDSDTTWLWQTVGADSSVRPSITLSLPSDAAGSYTVSATAKDSSGEVASDSATIKVGDSTPTKTETGGTTPTRTESSGTTPADTATTPADTDTTPADTATTPADTDTTPADTDTTPADTDTTPVGGSDGTQPPGTEGEGGGLPMTLLGGLVLIVGVAAGGLYWRQQTADSGWSPPDDYDDPNDGPGAAGDAYDEAGGAGGNVSTGAAESGDSARELLDEARRHADTAERRQDRGDLEGALDALEEAVGAAQGAQAAATEPHEETEASTALDDYRAERDDIRQRREVVEDIEEATATAERRFRAADEAMDESRTEAAAEKYRQARDQFQEAVDIARSADVDEFAFTAEGFRVREVSDLESRRDAAERSYERHSED